MKTYLKEAAVAPLRVIIGDGDRDSRRAMRDRLQEGGVTVIAEAATGRETLELSVFYKPDVVLVETLLPDSDGVTVTRELCARIPGTAVVLLSETEDPELGLMALRAGAQGFLGRDLGLNSLPRALRAAHHGEAVISRRLTMRIIDGMRRVREDGAGLRPVRNRLTSREWEVLDLLCEQLSTDEIADTLVLSPETVRSHIKNLLRKLGVRSRREAVEQARRLRSQMITVERPAA
ncbi:MAG TPA: response regulator transcription factor [Solirubrobacteraceae bacterium]|nr:response regulator transcription factor [Solirubrobacteraceae bacterium]